MTRVRDQSPTSAATQDAEQRRLEQPSDGRLLEGYEEIHSSREIRESLKQGSPVLLCMFLNDTYRLLSDAAPVLQDPTTFEALGHAILAVGYDDTAAHFKIRDSRGAAFAAGGHWFMPYPLSASSDLIFEAYRLTSVIPVP